MRSARTRVAIAVLGLALLATAGSAGAESSAPAPKPLPPFERVMLPGAPKPIADFELTDQNGRSFKFSSLRGRPTLVVFGFTNCPDVCPVTLQKLKTFRASNPSLARVRVVMISVDGERDSPAAMKEYLAHFSPDFVGLTGEPTKVRGIVGAFSAMMFKGQASPDTGAYNVQHSSQVYAIDKAGNLRAELYDAPPESIRGVLTALLNE